MYFFSALNTNNSNKKMYVDDFFLDQNYSADLNFILLTEILNMQQLKKYNMQFFSQTLYV